MALEQKDIELIERIVYKNSDDVAVSMSRSFERLEERMDAAESRTITRIADMEEQIEKARLQARDDSQDIKKLILELSRLVGECARGHNETK